MTALLIALLFVEQEAHAEDAAAQSTPAPDPGAASPPPAPAPVATDPPAPEPTPPAPAPAPEPTPPAPTPDTVPGPAGPVTPTGPGDESVNGSIDRPAPQDPGSHNSQDADVTTVGTAVANTGSNAGSSTGPANGPGTTPVTPGGTTTGVDTGTATGRGSVDHSDIQQEINATVTDNGKIVVVQVAIVVNIGIGIAGSGSNVATAGSTRPPTPVSSVGMIVGNELNGAGTGPNPVLISTGSATSTGNSGNTKVTQSIVLTGTDVASQLAAVLNIGVGVANSGLNFALASVSSNNQGAPSSVTFVTMGGGASIGAGPATALGNRSHSAVFQVVTVSASGNGSLLVIQRAIIVNFGLALANSGLNVAGGGALTDAIPDAAAAQQLLLMLLGPSPADANRALGGPVDIQTGTAHAIGNDTTTGILQQVKGSVSGNDTARAIQDAWVGNFGIGIANSGANGANALAGIDAASLDAARSALQAFLAGLTAVGDPLQGLDGTFQLGSNLLQLHGDVSGTQALLGITEPGTDIGPDDASVVIRQVTAVLNIGLALGDSGHNVATSGSNGTTVGGPGTTVASTTITTGDALAVGSNFAATVCQAIGDSTTCAARTPTVRPEAPEPTPQAPEAERPTTNPTNPFSPPDAPVRPATVVSTLPFTGSPIGAELAAGSGLLIAGMLLARRRRSGART